MHIKRNPITLGIMMSLAGSLWCTSLSVLADTADEVGDLSLSDLMNIEIVSATRSESKLSESPVPISVITAKEIADSGLDNIPDILARLPEIDVLHIGRSQTEVSLRGKGINFNRRLLVLIDGRTEYNDLFGVTLWHAFPIAMDDIERIEVVRGPASALFGANAYSGVINIITKAPDADGVSIARAQFGENGSDYATLSVNAKTDAASLKVTYSRQAADSPQTDVRFAGFNRIDSTVNFAADDASLDDMQRLNITAKYVQDELWDFRLNAGGTDGTLELFQQPGLPREKWDIEGKNVHAAFNYYVPDGATWQFNIYKNVFDYTTGLVPTRAAQEQFERGR